MKTHETPLTTTKSQTFSPNLWSIHFLAGHPTLRQRDVEKRPGQDEISRFALVPSTGAALLFLRDVDRKNFGPRGGHVGPAMEMGKGYRIDVYTV